jgi:leucyl-tRNA synthetase
MKDVFEAKKAGIAALSSKRIFHSKLTFPPIASKLGPDFNLSVCLSKGSRKTRIGCVMSKDYDDYDFRRIEEKWQKAWDERKTFEVREDSARPKFYCLEMYPYPSGRIHMGHVRNYSIGDVIARFKTMKGYNVLHPFGWDALGLPAENAAIKHGIDPRTWTLENIGHMKAQLRRMGFAYDWSREVNTCLAEYYKWNQWLFLKMFENGLAYRKKSWVNWCPECQTVLANEQAAGGECWRCSAEVEQKKMEHWFLKITDYAEELLSGHDQLSQWPEHVLLMQKNWIGKSRGAYVDFYVPYLKESIRVFTTRIDTIYGATFLVLSPEHPASHGLIEGDQEEKLHEWIARTVAESRRKRGAGEAEKEGINTGKKAVNPFTGEEIPIWIANYVLMEYGTGAIMAVPAHDARDFEFAIKNGLVVREVIKPEQTLEERRATVAGDAELFEDYGALVNSGPFSGMKSAEAMDRMADFAKEKGFGEKALTYRLRDWGISRQRYWGTPIPVIFCEKCGIVGVPYEDLPVRIPHGATFTGEAGSPLERIPAFINTVCPRCGGPGRRETDTMDTFVDSSWYFFRYASPNEGALPFARKAADYWLPVDLYIGGVEHAILHLIYARFFTKVIRDLGLSDLDEPFPHYLAQGMVIKDGVAMSKSKGNVVDPDEMLENYGADALRLFILFAAPPEKEFAWSEDGIEGSYRFLCRVWQTFKESRVALETKSDASERQTADFASYSKLQKKMHQTIRKVGEDIEKRFHLNTAISSIMEFVNTLRKEKDLLMDHAPGRALVRQALETLTLLLSPFTPHIAEELWLRMGRGGLVFHARWPSFDPALAQEEKSVIAVEINGKVRDKFEADAGTSEDELKARALELPRIRALIGAKPVQKVVCVKDKIVNIVI